MTKWNEKAYIILGKLSSRVTVTVNMTVPILEDFCIL
jgi:hypothetical protein